MLRAGPGETPARHFYELISKNAFGVWLYSSSVQWVSVQCEKHWLSDIAATSNGVGANRKSIRGLHPAATKTSRGLAKPNTSNEPKAASHSGCNT